MTEQIDGDRKRQKIYKRCNQFTIEFILANLEAEKEIQKNERIQLEIKRDRDRGTEIYRDICNLTER